MTGTSHFATFAEARSTGLLALLAAQSHGLPQSARGLCVFLPCFHGGRRSGHKYLAPCESVVTLSIDGRLSGWSRSLRSAARLCESLRLSGYVSSTVLRNLPLHGGVFSVLMAYNVKRVVVSTGVPADFLAVSIVQSVKEAHMFLYPVSV